MILECVDEVGVPAKITEEEARRKNLCHRRVVFDIVNDDFAKCNQRVVFNIVNDDFAKG